MDYHSRWLNHSTANIRRSFGCNSGQDSKPDVLRHQSLEAAGKTSMRALRRNEALQQSCHEAAMPLSRIGSTLCIFYTVDLPSAFETRSNAKIVETAR